MVNTSGKSQLDNGTVDVTYGRNTCQEPNQELDKAAWIDELCEQGYWTRVHWDCANISSRSFDSINGFRLYESELTFGGRVTGTIEVVNRIMERRFGCLIVELVTNLLESKKFPVY